MIGPAPLGPWQFLILGGGNRRIRQLDTYVYGAVRAFNKN
jgi:hypothetical protein